MLDIIKNAAKAAGEIQKTYFRQTELDVVQKTNHENIVTKVDLASQKIIHEYILKHTKEMGIDPADVGFIGEEDLRTTGDHMFIIDPLDGTSNFATGTEEFLVLVAYFFKGELRSGVAYSPMKDYMYVAEKGAGAYAIKKGKRVEFHLRNVDLQNSFLLSSMSYHAEIQAGIPEITRALKPLFRGVRMYGCAGLELAFMLEGIAGVVVGYGVSIWDIAPGLLMLREVGYELYDFQGKLVAFDLTQPKKTYPFLACHPDNKKEIMKRMQTY